jgi:hypothetical protein
MDMIISHIQSFGKKKILNGYDYFTNSGLWGRRKY